MTSTRGLLYPNEDEGGLVVDYLDRIQVDPLVLSRGALHQRDSDYGVGCVGCPE